MNYLAHMFLSGDSKDVLFGNFIGDAVKGSQYNNYPEAIKKGILLHREIDSFTDSHPVYLKSKRRFYKNYPKISGVITDILYDHILSLEWRNHTHVELNEFIKQTYTHIDDRVDELPEKMVYIYRHMRTNDWFTRYQSSEGTALSLNQIGIRMGFGDSIGKSIIEFEENKALFIEEFNEFFNDIKNISEEFLQKHQ